MCCCGGRFALENAGTVPPLVQPTELHAVSGKGQSGTHTLGPSLAREPGQGLSWNGCLCVLPVCVAGLRCRVGSEVVVVGTGLWMKEMGVTLASDTDQRAAKVHTRHIHSQRGRDVNGPLKTVLWCVVGGGGLGQDRGDCCSEWGSGGLRRDLGPAKARGPTSATGPSTRPTPQSLHGHR